MKTKVTETSINVYHSEINGQTEDTQEKIIYLAMLQYGRPMTCRMVQRYLKERGFEYEVNVMSRSMSNLKSGKGEYKIYFVVDRACEVTERIAGYFSTVEPKPEPQPEPGIQSRMNF